MRLRGARVLLPGVGFVVADVEIADGLIVGVGEGSGAARPDDLDLTGRLLVPGMIDTHVHGRLGHHVMAATRDAVDGLARALLATGTTSFVGTTATVEFPRLVRAVADLAPLVGPVADGAELLGIHLEGPFLGAEHRGVHRAEHLVDPTPERLDALLDAAGAALRICTLAPERDPSGAAIRRLTAAGVRVSVGHTGADLGRTARAIDEGAVRATHLFNGMAPFHHRHPGPVPALLGDRRVLLELVGDGVHVDPALVVAMLDAPALRDRVLLVSDGTDVAGLPDGPHRRWEGTEVRLEGGRAEATGGGIAGGTASVLDAVRLAIEHGAAAETAFAAGARVPARSLGLQDRGSIEVGMRADLLVLDEALRLERTILRGSSVERRE